jgi:hypothetical protein
VYQHRVSNEKGWKEEEGKGDILLVLAKPEINLADQVLDARLSRPGANWICTSRQDIYSLPANPSDRQISPERHPSAHCKIIPKANQGFVPRDRSIHQGKMERGSHNTVNGTEASTVSLEPQTSEELSTMNEVTKCILQIGKISGGRREHVAVVLS